MSATAASTRRASCAPIETRNRARPPHACRAAPCRRIFFGGGTPSLMQPATGRGDPRRDRQALERSRPTSRSRWRPIRPASRRRASAAIARPASTASRSACRRSTMPRSRSSAACTRRRRRSTPSRVARSIFERYSFDLIYARPAPDARSLGGRAQARHRRSRRASLALSTDHRARHAVLRPARRRQARRARRRSRARSLRSHAGDLRRGRPAGLRDLQPRAAGRRVPAQSGLLARPRICRHRPGRAWPAQCRRPPLRHRNRKAAGELADARGGTRHRPDRRREAHARRDRRRISC